MMILTVDLEMFSQMDDPIREKSDLDLRRTGVIFVELVARDRCCSLFFALHQSTLLQYFLCGEEFTTERGLFGGPKGPVLVKNNSRLNDANAAVSDSFNDSSDGDQVLAPVDHSDPVALLEFQPIDKDCLTVSDPTFLL